MLWLRDMRAAIAFIITAGVAGAVVLQKQRESQHVEPAAAKPAAVSAAQGPAPSAGGKQPVAQHWPKRALDRAADVKRQVGDQRNSDETR